MPADDRLRLDDQKHISPAGPGVSQNRPEQAVQKVERRPGPFPFEDAQLLAKRQDFQCHVGAVAAEEARAAASNASTRVSTDLPVLTCRNATPEDADSANASH